MSDVLPFTTATTADGRLCELFEALGAVKGGKLFRGRLSGAAGFSKIVAIKMVEQGSAERAELGQRLRDEARLLAFLKHRAIVTVDDLIQVGGRWAVVMEFVDGRDLSALMAGGALPPRVVSEIALEIASALAVAHEATDPATGQPLGLVHRNVQPSNMRVTPKGEVKLVGFGFARARFSGREAQTGYLTFDQAGFLAPERLLGQDSAASDVYGLGASLASALLGENIRSLSPISSSHAAGVAEIRGRLLSSLTGPENTALVELIARTILYAPEARPTARALEAELGELLGRIQGPTLRRWAPENVKPYAPPPPAPVVPEVEPRPIPAVNLTLESPEAARRAESRMPSPAAERGRAGPTPPPLGKGSRGRPSRTSVPEPSPESVSPQRRVVIIAVLGSAALAFFLGAAVLIFLALTLSER